RRGFDRHIDQPQAHQLLEVADSRAGLVRQIEHLAERAAPVHHQQHRAVALAQAVRAMAQLVLAECGLAGYVGGGHRRRRRRASLWPEPAAGPLLRQTETSSTRAVRESDNNGRAALAARLHDI